MKLSTKGRYGVKAMVDLAIHYGDAPVSIKTISNRQSISEYYLEQLFSPLRKAKLITSIRGAQGGYVLGREPKDIKVSDSNNDLLDVIENLNKKERIIVFLHYYEGYKIKEIAEIMKLSEVNVKVLKVENGKISLSMKALEEVASEEEDTSGEEVVSYKDEGDATTGLGALLAGLKL